MTEEEIDLAQLVAGCAEEPIHTPGAVQPHGALLALDADARIVVASANTGVVLGIDAVDLLGTSLSQRFGHAFAAAVLAAESGDIVVLPAPNGLGSLEVVTHDGDGLRLVELESDRTTTSMPGELRRALRGFHSATSVAELVAQSARAVQELTGFDRVMVYRFDPEWNGEVVAEVLCPGHSGFLGLRFPASDIPPQARALYSRARLRLIPDALAPPSALVAVDANAAAAAIDLSDVALRAVSPVHLQYLRNMGVAASMSVAIHLREQLWGLIACHNLTGPLRPSFRVRDAVDLVGRTTSTVLAALVSAESAAAQVALLGQLDAMTEPLSALVLKDPGDALAESDPEFPALLAATGAAVVNGSTIRTAGLCPPPEMIANLIDHVRDRDPRELCTDELASVDPSWCDVAESAAGAVVVPVDARGDRWLAWFRPETRASIRWGGDPSTKDIAIDVTGLRLDPRASFDVYLEEVEGRSVPWTDAQLSVARTLARRLAELYAGRTRHNAEVAAAIQRTVLLESFPEIAGVDGAARYVPSAGDPIGGDWYDVFFRPEGGPILALGDVAGHGVEAAATMAQLRNALRAYVIREESPREAMSRLNELMMTLLPDEMATALLVELDPVGRTTNIVNAGHYPPLVIGPDGARLLEAGTNVALGVSSGMQYTSMRVDLPIGSTLVAYTDGLIEKRTRSLDDSFAALLDAATGPEGESVDDLCDRLLAAAAVDVGIGDDITVVAIRFTAA